MMSTATRRTRETLPEIKDAPTAADTDQVSAVRETARSPGPAAEEPAGPREPAAGVMEVGGASLRGPGRALNQDVFSAWREMGLCVVADGMGGRPAGEVAAAMAVAEIHAFLDDSDPERTPAIALDVTQGLAAGLLVRAVEHANMAVYSVGLAQTERRGMGAAVAALLVAGPRIVAAHVGDSRVYRYRGGGLEKLTEDHSHAALYEAWKGQAADPEIVREHRSVLTQAVGPAPTVRVAVRVEPLEAGDLFLLCSDGLWGYLRHDAMAAVIAAAPSLEHAAKALVARALEAGGTDDVTAVLVRPLPKVGSERP